MSFAKQKIFILQANAIYQQVGYPDYLGSDNNTLLEEEYAEVKKYNEKSLGVFLFLNYLVCIQFDLY